MTERLLVFSDTEYESRWKKVELEMISRGLDNFDGSLGEFYTKHWYKPFQEKFDVKMNFIKLKGSRVPLEKVQAQINAGKPETDVMPMHQDQVIFAQRNNLAMEVDASAIPEFSNYYDKGITAQIASNQLGKRRCTTLIERLEKTPITFNSLDEIVHEDFADLEVAIEHQQLD